MKILFAASEAVPFCKTGGLADVAGSLPQALAGAGNDVAVILPLYQQVADKWKEQMTFVCSIEVTLSWRHLYCGLFRLERDNVTWYFVDNEYYFKRGKLYGYDDDPERFGFFSRAVVSLLPSLCFTPDIIHCNDWQTALIPIYLKDDCVRLSHLRQIKTVFTVHNVEYQGRCGRHALGDIFGLHSGWFSDGTIAMDGDVNLLKGAAMVCDAITAVSPTYAQELRQAFFAHGMESVMEMNAHKLHGVLNGIDMERYNPVTDPGLVMNFSAEDMAGKARNKAALQEEMGLPVDPSVPVIGIVTRLVSHKGLDLICDVFHQIMDLNCQLVVLGSGDAQYENFFSAKQPLHPDRMALHLGYNEALATRIYAGADILLMPSKSEPCGLAQMIAMRYGTLPIVRETGGLKDTVHAYEAWSGNGNGFSFAAYNSADMLYVIRQAVDLYFNNPNAFDRLRQTGMTTDFSWNASAEAYNKLYRSICS